MPAPKLRQTHAALLALLELAERDPRLVAEMARARREFFGPALDDDTLGPVERASALTRFSEWYLLERESEVLGGIPLEVMTGDPATLAALRERLGESLVGVFKIESSAPGSARAEDLQDGETVVLVLDANDRLEPGDVLIGRIYPVELGSYVPSAAAALERSAKALADAFVKDVESLGLARRLGQIELEHLLFGRGGRSGASRAAKPPVVPIERLEAELDSLLRAAGHGSPDAREISELLRESEQPGPVMGPLLEQIAFETSADLDQVQRLLLRLWSTLHAREAEGPTHAAAGAGDTGSREAASTPAVPGLGRTLAERIERGLREHEGVEAIFADVEKLLGEQIDPDQGSDGPAGPQDGDLEGLVAEFLWETGTEHQKEAQVLAALVRQQRESPLPKLDVETLESQDLLRLFVDAYLRAAPSQRAMEVQATFAAIERFARWLHGTHDLDVGAALSVARTVFVAHVERVAAASLALSTGPDQVAADPETRVELWQVAASGHGRDGGIAAEIVAMDGDRRALISAGRTQVCDLRVGDLLLGSVRFSGTERAAFVGMVVVLPPGVEPVLG